MDRVTGCGHACQVLMWVLAVVISGAASRQIMATTMSAATSRGLVIRRIRSAMVTRARDQMVNSSTRVAFRAGRGPTSSSADWASHSWVRLIARSPVKARTRASSTPALVVSRRPESSAVRRSSAAGTAHPLLCAGRAAHLAVWPCSR